MNNSNELKVAQDVTLEALKLAEKRLDNELEKLENQMADDNEMEKLRKKRLKDLKSMQKKKMEWVSQGHGSYSEVPDQAEWFNVTKANERVVCHFYRPSTWRCEIIDKHLTELARKHIETKFIKINAEKSPYLAQKLNIVLMPTIVCTKNNYTEDFIEGFDQLGGVDTFTTDTLARRLAVKGAIDYVGEKDPGVTKGKFSMNTVSSNKQGAAIYRGGKQSKKKADDDDSWDELSDD